MRSRIVAFPTLAMGALGRSNLQSVHVGIVPKQRGKRKFIISHLLRDLIPGRSKFQTSPSFEKRFKSIGPPRIFSELQLLKDVGCVLCIFNRLPMLPFRPCRVGTCKHAQRIRKFPKFKTEGDGWRYVYSMPQHRSTYGQCVLTMSELNLVGQNCWSKKGTRTFDTVACIIVHPAEPLKIANQIKCNSNCINSSGLEGLKFAETSRVNCIAISKVASSERFLANSSLFARTRSRRL